MNRQTDRKKDRQTDRQIDRQREVKIGNISISAAKLEFGDLCEK